MYPSSPPSTPTPSTTPSNSIFSPSPTTARCSATSCWKSPGRKTTRRTVLSRAGGSHPTTGAGPHPSLLDRLLGTDPNALRSGVCPDCRQKWTTHPGSHDHSDPSTVEKVEDLRSDEERWAKIEANLKRMEDEGILTPDPNGSPIDISNYRMPKDFDSTPYEEEEAASFRAEIKLRLERQKQWPESKNAGERSSPKSTRPTPKTTNPQTHDDSWTLKVPAPSTARTPLSRRLMYISVSRPLGLSIVRELPFVIPAQAGIQRGGGARPFRVSQL